MLYKKQNINCIIFYKYLIKLQTTIVFKKVFEEKQKNIKKNIRNIVVNKRVEKELYSNTFK